MTEITLMIGQRIRNRRQKLKLTQEELAEKADLHHTYIGQVERGEKNLTVAALAKILQALDLSFSDFFEHFGIASEDQGPAEKSYELIHAMNPAAQEKVYQLLCDITDILSSRS